MTTIRLKVGLLAAALAFSQGANASLLIGFYDFRPGAKPMIPTDDPAEYAAVGSRGWVESPEQATQGDGGSYDATYGNSGIPTGEIPSPQLPPGNGAATIRSIPDPSNPLFSVLTFWVENTGTLAIPLGKLFFDAAEPDSGGVVNQVLKVSWSPTGDLATSIPLAPPIDVIAETAGNIYVGYSLSLAGFMLDPGNKIAFLFTSDYVPASGNYNSDTIWIDNVGISAVPEPGSVVGLGCVLAAGFMLRHRRRPVR